MIERFDQHQPSVARHSDIAEVQGHCLKKQKVFKQLIGKILGGIGGFTT
jgi:hypothetical protein